MDFDLQTDDNKSNESGDIELPDSIAVSGMSTISNGLPFTLQDTDYTPQSTQVSHVDNYR
jgi:hypothetical protein